MYMRVNIGNLRNELSKYLSEVKSGKEVIVTDHNEPVAKIVPLTTRSLVKSNLAEWLKEHPPVQPRKRLKAFSDLVRQMRDEDER